MKPEKIEHIAKILGIGFDQEDGHTRRTQGANFELFQGSEKTHDRMQAICLIIEERLKASGKHLDQLSREEFVAIVSDLEDEDPAGSD
jgi:hypothetical protein